MARPNDSQKSPSIGLPLTEATNSPLAGQLVSETHIRDLVDTFYQAIRADDLLGPIFDRHVKDWSLHLPKMYDFWSTVVLRTGRYAGRPIEAHERIPGLTAAHFQRWIALWTRTVQRVVPISAQDLFIVSAQRMARSMSDRLIA